jgi:protoporphyrinogen oxidase/glycosyltransferase involved in cell wall biosynthesis
MPSAIIVFSHLRWDFVCQRPQHLLSRLAAHFPIVFIEEPVFDDSESFFKTWSPVPNVLVCQPHTPVNMPGFHDDQLPYLQKLLRQLVRDYDEHIAWFYTPMALPLLQELHPQLVVYDCMDELAALRNAPRQLAQRESGLLKTADIVFADGQGLYRSRWDRHPNVHCFPGSVDAAHFVPALDRSNSHPAHRDIGGPRLGFHGVIDERFDAELIGKLADAHAQWQIVLAGPVVGIDPASLPQRPNIHYLGQQPYDALPHFLAGWDVCLLPFALNEATRFISPAMVLEYMAAELPIVSTPVADVADLYGDIVTIAADATAFIAACEAALLAPPEQTERNVRNMRKVVAATSWDATVEKMRALLRNTRRRAPEPLPAVEDVIDAEMKVNRLRQQGAVRFARTVIIGAGAAGLSAAYHLGHDAVLLEKESMVGGGCRSVKDNGFTFDHAGHGMVSDDPYVLELVELLLGSNLHWQNREAWAYRNGMYTRYHGTGQSLPPHAGSADDTAPSNVAALRPADQPMTPGARFGYPLRGGFQALMSGFVPHIKGTIELNADVVQVSPRQRTVTLADGRHYQYENLICTMPLPHLVRMAGDEAPDAVKRAAQGLKHVAVRCVNLGVARENLTDKHWICYPEDTIFQRIFVQGNASPECNAPGGFGLSCEIRYSPDQPLPIGGSALIERCVQDCIKVGLLRDDDTIITANEIDMPYAHVVYDAAREKNVGTIRAWLETHGIHLAGRYAEWEDGHVDQAFMAGKRAAETVKWMEPKSAVAAE